MKELTKRTQILLIFTLFLAIGATAFATSGNFKLAYFFVGASVFSALLTYILTLKKGRLRSKVLWLVIMLVIAISFLLVKKM